MNGGFPDMKYGKYDLRAIKDCADPLVVAESIGLEVKRYGSKLSILCPNPEHADRHFGNCKLTNEGYKCYACGDHGDVFTLVQNALGVSAHESYSIVADICGGQEHFRIRDCDKNEEEKRFTKLPSKETLAFIGLDGGGEFTTKGVYKCKTILGAFEEYEKEQGEIVKFEAGKTPEQDCKIVLQRIDANPLQTLANDEPEIFYNLICSKAEETMEKYAEMIRCVQSQDTKSVLGYYCNKVSSESGSDVFIKVCKENIVKARAIAERFSQKQPNRNIFGKIKIGAAL